jgi:hypothetical protein
MIGFGQKNGAGELGRNIHEAVESGGVVGEGTCCDMDARHTQHSSRLAELLMK